MVVSILVVLLVIVGWIAVVTSLAPDSPRRTAQTIDRLTSVAEQAMQHTRLVEQPMTERMGQSPHIIDLDPADVQVHTRQP